MASFTQLNYHIVFATKYRRPWIKDHFEERLYEYLGGIIRSHKGSLIQIGGTSDHLHLLTRLSPTLAVSDVIRAIKANSSKWVSEIPNGIPEFEWQKGYGAFTVSFSNMGSVQSYIRNQKEHHRTRTFQEEFIEILQKHQIEFRPEYLFEDEHHG